jgi:hypothetical protein
MLDWLLPLVLGFLALTLNIEVKKEKLKINKWTARFLLAFGILFMALAIDIGDFTLSVGAASFIGASGLPRR